jgi:hypothetical protein
MYENTRVAASAGTVNSYLPSGPETVPTVVDFTITVTPGTGAPSGSEIDPEICFCCAEESSVKAIIMAINRKARKPLKRFFFIDFLVLFIKNKFGRNGERNSNSFIKYRLRILP